MASHRHHEHVSSPPAPRELARPICKESLPQVSTKRGRGRTTRTGRGGRGPLPPPTPAGERDSARTRRHDPGRRLQETVAPRRPPRPPAGPPRRARSGPGTPRRHGLPSRSGRQRGRPGPGKPREGPGHLRSQCLFHSPLATGS